jgi:hypothetical protein
LSNDETPKTQTVSFLTPRKVIGGFHCGFPRLEGYEMTHTDKEVPYARQGGGSLPRFRRRMYEEEIAYLEGEIQYLSEIQHPRHEYMIQKRKQRVKELKEKMR